MKITYKNRLIINILIAYIISLFFYSCYKEEKHDQNKIFRYNESANITTLDPAFAKDQAIIWACNQIYNGLVQLDDGLNIKPCIAKSWTISEDGRIYKFILRDDVYFH